jgi:nitrite reductase/ring-hydroxylating ferredoxin subunit
MTDAIRVDTAEGLALAGMKVLSAGERTVVVVSDDGDVFALDNRCPHMGFPLHRGTVRNGLLTCHWHHARFDLASGCTLDPFADDAPSFRVWIDDGIVWLDPVPIAAPDPEHWLRKLDEGLEQGISLVLAKSAIQAAKRDRIPNVLARAALFGIRNRASGWSTGLSILSACANIADSLESRDRPKALFHGLAHVARSTANQPPNFDLEPLQSTNPEPENLARWFRTFIEVRSGAAAEKTLRTAIRAGLSERTIAGMIFTACTDHLFADVGHSLDFANKAFELLRHIGWGHAEEVLPALVPVMTGATRMEEDASWRHPLDLADLLFGVFDDLDGLIEEGARRDIRAWTGHRELAEQILDGDPADTIALMRELVRTGVSLPELSATVAYAAARRPLHFSTANEFDDWETVHHSFTYANAVDQGIRFAPSAALARGIFDGAMSVYLERFLNLPKRPTPEPSGGSPTAQDLLVCFDEHGRVDETAQVVCDMLALGKQDDVVRALGHAMLREDATFHQYQIFEAAIRQFRTFAGRPEGDHILMGIARYLTAHAPTTRAMEQTYSIASRLHRGEPIHEGIS